MPYTAKQKRAFRAAEHDPETARRMGMSQETAKKLYHEAKRTRTRPALTRKAKAERS